MHETDAGLIRRPMLTGHQRIAGLWFSAERFSHNERARLLLENWQTGAAAYRFAQGDLLCLTQTITVQCEAVVGWPLIHVGRTLCSALLDPQEMQCLPQADLWLVRGSQVSALHLRDALLLAPGEWLDITGVTLLDTYDCRQALPEPLIEQLPVNTDIRQILGDALKPVTAQQQQVMQALLERQHKAKAAPHQPRQSEGAGWSSPEPVALPWLKLVVSLVLLLAVFWMGYQDQHSGVNAIQVDRVTSLSVQIGAVVVGLLIGAITLTLLLAGLGHLLRRPVAMAPSASKAPSQPAIAARAQSAVHKPALWRRWVTRLTQHSRLSALYGRRQARYIQRMLAMFEDGDLEEALRHAIPLGAEQHSGEQSFGTPQRRTDLSISRYSTLARAMVFEHDIETDLRRIYRQTFERLDRQQRIEEAVFVLAELLKVRDEALDYLEKHGREQQAADLALAWDMPAATIVRLLCLAGDWQRALLVARRDDAFADAVAMLQEKSPLFAERLRLEWAESLARKGLWLQAVEALWPLTAERQRATQWLLNAEAAGGSLAVGALVKRAILLPDTLIAYAERVEQMRDDPARHGERATLAESLLQHKAHTGALAWLAGAIVHAVIADQLDGHGRLSQTQLQALVSMSKDRLLQIDLPEQMPTRPAAHARSKDDLPLQWQAPQRGIRPILDAVPLEDQRYLLALGEAGAVVIDAHGQVLFQFALPAQHIVLAQGRQVALVLARRDEVWRIGKLDLVTRVATDLGVQMFDVFSRTFNGSNWTIGRGRQVRVVDVDRGFETLWHVSDLPAPIRALKDDAFNETLWLAEPEKGAQVWNYRLPERRLMTRLEVFPIGPADRYLLNADGRVKVMTVLPENDAGEPELVIEGQHECNHYPLPELHIHEALDERVDVHWHEHVMFIGYPVNDHDLRWHFIATSSMRHIVTLQWPRHGVRLRAVGADHVLFDDQGRLSHFNVDTVTQHNLTLN